METWFGAPKPGKAGTLYPRVTGSRFGEHIVSQGLEWRPYLWTSGAATAGVFVMPSVPATLTATAASSAPAAEGELLTGAAVACPRVRVSVRSAAGQQAWSGQCGGDDSAFVRMGNGRGWREALTLREAATNQEPSSRDGASASTSQLAARWAPYLQGGTRLEGSMVLLPPPY
ncbi:hypothetical protein HXX76_011784 [Chlamydomonas incerta]|nr:hypothetical protein HXX76_011784 [Chlamydomonas incerta]|eukprot:KAG2426559.1 hypothetical protein HXX76_011784 [Chlamydomonas incerta]